MQASARGWSEQDRAAKRLILMLKTLLMVMFKTSKCWLTEKKHLHTDEVEQMSSLESVKVRHRRRNAACWTTVFLWELPGKLWFGDAGLRPFIYLLAKLRPSPTDHKRAIILKRYSAVAQLQGLFRLNRPCRSFNTWLDMRQKRTRRCWNVELLMTGRGLICMDFLLELWAKG